MDDVQHGANDEQHNGDEAHEDDDADEPDEQDDAHEVHRRAVGDQVGLPRPFIFSYAVRAMNPAITTAGMDENDLLKNYNHEMDHH